LLLDGVWKFDWHKKPADKPAGFYRQGYDASKWNDIQVPGNWELQGFDKPIYTNWRYPWKLDKDEKHSLQAKKGEWTKGDINNFWGV
jgi:beta-galactosidase/beta-glucuronidase